MKSRKINKIMLIFPPTRIGTVVDKMVCPPMGLSYLGAVLRNRYEVKILDSVLLGHHQERKIKADFFEYGLSPEEIVKEVESFSPEVVGISCLFSPHLALVKELSSRIKKISPEIITVTGGTHPSFLPEQSFNYAPDLDYIVIGEAEESFPKLLSAIEKGSGLEEIDGLAYRTDGGVRVNPKTKWIENLDQIPFPARDLLMMEKYFEINIPFLFYSKSPRNTSFITSRGCPFKCSFCSSCNFWGNRVRYRSLENVLEEMRELKNRWRVEELKFEEDNLLLNRERAKRLFRAMIEERFNFHWNMPNGAYVMSLLDEELVRLMKESGCFEVVLAFESGDQEVMDKIIKKPLDLKKGERAVKILRDHGIGVLGFFIVGFPGETKEQIKNTFRFAQKLKLDQFFSFLYNPLPGSELYQLCLEKGYITPESAIDVNYAESIITTDQFDPSFLRRMGFFNYFYHKLFLFLRNPVKLFRKNLKRMFRKYSIRTTLRIFQTSARVFFRDVLLYYLRKLVNRDRGHLQVKDEISQTK